MKRRFQTLGLGASLLALLGGASLGGQAVFAQTPATPAAVVSTGSAAPSAYSVFVANLATDLGIADSTKVDAAIRSSLKQMVDTRLASGDISAKEATTLKARIDASNDASGLLGLDDFTGDGSMAGDANDGENADQTGGSEHGGGNDVTDQADQSGDVNSEDGSPDNQQGVDSGGDQETSDNSGATATVTP